MSHACVETDAYQSTNLFASDDMDPCHQTSLIHLFFRGGGRNGVTEFRVLTSPSTGMLTTGLQTFVFLNLCRRFSRKARSYLWIAKGK